MGRGGGSFSGDRVVGGSGAEMERREAGSGLDNRPPASPSETFGFFGLRAFLGGVLGSGEAREPPVSPAPAGRDFLLAETKPGAPAISPPALFLAFIFLPKLSGVGTAKVDSAENNKLYISHHSSPWQEKKIMNDATSVCKSLRLFDKD